MLEYYYDPRCLRKPSSNLAMFCVPSVKILATILESILWCHFVVGILLLGIEPEIHPTYLVLIVFASSFRILVTFAIVLEVRGTSFFQLPWTILGRSSSEPKDDNKSALDEFSMLYCDSASSTFLHGLSGRIMLNLVRQTNLCIHNSENHMFLELSLFSCILTLVYQLIVKSMRAFVYRYLLLLWSVKPFYRRMTRRNKLQYLFHIQDWVKEVVLRRSNC